MLEGKSLYEITNCVLIHALLPGFSQDLGLISMIAAYPEFKILELISFRRMWACAHLQRLSTFTESLCEKLYILGNIHQSIQEVRKFQQLSILVLIGGCL